MNMNATEITNNPERPKNLRFTFLIIPLFVILIVLFTTILINFHNKINLTVKENNLLKQQIISTNFSNSKEDIKDSTSATLTPKKVKVLNYEGTNYGIYTFIDSQAKNFYFIVSEEKFDSDWFSEGFFDLSGAEILTKHQYLAGDGSSFADVAGNKLVALNSFTKSITIFEINNKYKIFSVLKTIQIPESMKGVPHTVICTDEYYCNVFTAVHLEAGCRGTLRVDDGTFFDTNCPQGQYSEFE